LQGATGATGPAGPGTSIQTFQITSSTSGTYYPTLVTGTTGQTAGISNTNTNLFSFSPSTGIISVTGGYTGGAIFSPSVNYLSLGIGEGGSDSNVSIGNAGFVNNINGTNIIAIGKYALQNSGSSSLYGENVAIGTQSLANLGTAIAGVANSNTAVGAFSGQNVTSSAKNCSFFGYFSGGSQTGGNQNTFIGSFTTATLSSYSNSTAIGYQATINASNQVVLGNSSVTQVTTSGALNVNNTMYVGLGGGSISSNIAIGATALIQNSSAIGNVAIGSLAMQSTTTGASNTAVGYQSLTTSVVGVANTAFGRLALTDTTGSRNTGIGINAGNLNAGGTGNTYIGAGTTIVGGPFFNSTAIGNQGTITASNQVVLGNTGVTQVVTSGALNVNNTMYVGLGGGVQDSNIAIGATALIQNTTGFNNVAVGSQALQNSTSNNNTAVGFNALAALTTGNTNTAIGRGSLSTTTGSSNIGIGVNAGTSNAGGTGNTYLGTSTGSTGGFTGSGPWSNSTAVGYQAVINASNQIALGSGIANIKCATTVIQTTSDLRDKKNVAPIQQGINLINDLNPVSFTWNMRDRSRVGDYDYGFIAQDIKKTIQKFGNVPSLLWDQDPENMGVGYVALLPVMVKAIQDLSAQVNTLTEQNQSLQSQINRIVGGATGATGPTGP
jgi:hypothetical protein